MSTRSGKLLHVVRDALRARRKTDPGEAFFYFAGAMTCLIFGMFAGSAWVGLMPDSHTAIGKAGLLAAQNGAMLCAGLLFLMFRPRFGVLVPARSGRRGLLIISLLGLLVFVPLTIASADLAAALYYLSAGAPPNPVSHKTLADLLSERDRLSVVIWSALLVTLVPLGEELLFRVFAQTAILGVVRSEFVSILLTSVVFSFLHYSVLADQAEGVSRFILLLPLFVLSMGTGWLYERTGGLLAPALLHGAFNFLNIMRAFWMSGG